MSNNEKHYNRKSQYNPNRESYVDENGNYVYLMWNSETNSYRREVCVVGEGGFSPEIRAVLDEMDADEDRRLDADRHHMDMVFEAKKRAYCNNQSEYANDPIIVVCFAVCYRVRQCTPNNFVIIIFAVFSGERFITVQDVSA